MTSRKSKSKNGTGSGGNGRSGSKRSGVRSRTKTRANGGVKRTRKGRRRIRLGKLLAPTALARRWRKAGPLARAGAVLAAVLVLVCMAAMVLGAARFVRWREERLVVEARQLALEQEYGFDPGDIISDAQFFNEHAMSRAEVQSFLESKGGALASMTFDTETMPADDYCAEYQGASGETAAAVIDKAARACGISQKVILTVLQKEQHLVTAAHPTEFQLKAAMGLSCPDDASCDPEYAGFFRQVYGAANRYQYYTKHEDRYGYHAGRINSVRYHPNAACGASDVYIRNKATALLYIYTPYQPNEAALKAGDGEGDACSSYGNRNFALIYSGWFGDPRS